MAPGPVCPEPGLPSSQHAWLGSSSMSLRALCGQGRPWAPSVLPVSPCLACAGARVPFVECMGMVSHIAVTLTLGNSYGRRSPLGQPWLTVERRPRRPPPTGAQAKTLQPPCPGAGLQPSPRPWGRRGAGLPPVTR